MKLVEQLLVRGRSWARRAGGPSRRPGALSLRMDDLDGPGPLVATLDLGAWQARVVELVMVLGALPVRVVGRASHPDLAELARFAWRLECPVVVRTSADLGRPLANALVSAGVPMVELLDGPEVEQAVRALVEAARTREARMEVVVEVRAGADLRGVAERVRAAGADGVRIGLPWSGGPFGAGLDEAAGWQASFHRTPASLLPLGRRYDGAAPGAPGEGRRCPVGRRRWELAADGTLYACPFKPGRVRYEAGAPDLAVHLEAIAACDRACGHTDLE